MVGDVEVDEFTALVAKDDEREQQAEGEGRDDEEGAGDDVGGMGGQERAPGRRGPTRDSVHVLGDREFGDVVSEQREFRLIIVVLASGICAAS